MKPFRLPFPALRLAVCLGAAPLAPAQAQSLLELYESARSYDAAYQSARAQHEASLARLAQAKAGLLPTVSMSVSAQRSELQNNNPVYDRYFGTQSATLNASQPLYRPANQAVYDQAQRQLDQVRAQLTAAEQDLIMRLSQAYFDVLGAQDGLTFVRAQKTAVAEQLAAAKRNFEVGASTITDTREAQARYDLVIAQEIAAENDLRVKKLTLDQLAGVTGTEPRPVSTPVALPALQPVGVESWVAQSESQHPAIAQARAALEVARLETLKAEAGHKPTLDLQASYSVTRNIDGSASTGANGPDFRTKLGAVGVAFSLPLFAGFSVQNRIRETLALQDKAGSDLEAARRSAAQATRTAYFSLLSGQSQVKALEAAELSSQGALEANKLGYQVGVRINIDVLNAQSQLYQTKRDLAVARYNILLGGLKLRQASGSLQVQDLQDVNALLAR